MSERPIAMGDVRLVLGEGRLNAAEVLRAVNVILARRTQRASTDGAFYKGVRASITWLHEEARSMNDPHAQQVLNNAAFSLGVSKPDPNAAAASPAEQSARPRETDWKARAERAEAALKGVDREVIARIIDPTYAKLLDERPDGPLYWRQRWTEALAKADAIIAALPRLLTDGVGESGASVAESADAPRFAAATEAQRKSEGGAS